MRHVASFLKMGAGEANLTKKKLTVKKRKLLESLIHENPHPGNGA